MNCPDCNRHIADGEWGTVVTGSIGVPGYCFQTVCVACGLVIMRKADIVWLPKNKNANNDPLQTEGIPEESTQQSS